MRSSSAKSGILVTCLVIMGLVSCGDDNEANKRGVGSECSASQACTETDQICLSFKGGYCGVQGCTADVDCPGGSACVIHTDSNSYCFLICNDKTECNVNRTTANESNCSSSVTFVENVSGRKACVPPSS